jgi:hypothetical protein
MMPVLWTSELMILEEQNDQYKEDGVICGGVMVISATSLSWVVVGDVPQ